MANLSNEEISDRVRYHAPSPNGVETHGILSGLFEKIMHEIQVFVPDGRERSIVMTRLEEAKMWASAGVARNPETR